MPFASFGAFNRDANGDIWFAFDESRPLAFFAGTTTRWTSVREVKEGETTSDPQKEIGARERVYSDLK